MIPAVLSLEQATMNSTTGKRSRFSFRIWVFDSFKTLLKTEQITACFCVLCPLWGVDESDHHSLQEMKTFSDKPHSFLLVRKSLFQNRNE
ncbi:MAG: hypothetical protein B7Z54_09060 [Sphingobacteriales bacterium 12-47-4]|nr:MAG: hypothetical protein B7Z54_09060 [Sphingobacteriales bacterium 12-47-4]